jgi:putative transposase
MQVFGLPRHVIRAGCAASRIAAKPPSSEAAIREATLARWMKLRSYGLTAGQAAAGIDQSRSTLYRWAKAREPKSRRPHCLRQKTWTPALMRAVERIRLDNPMWGKEKITVLLAREGIAASVSTVGRILKSLMERGVVTPVPSLRRKPGGRRFRIMARERHAKRLPKGMKPTRPRELVQIDTLFVSTAPGRAVKHFTAYDPVAKWTLGLVAGRATAHCATALLDKLVAEVPSRSKASRSTADRSSEPPSKRRQPVRPPTQAAPAQRPCRARPGIMAIRVLRRLRPAQAPRSPPDPRRRLRPPLQ